MCKALNVKCENNIKSKSRNMEHATRFTFEFDPYSRPANIVSIEMRLLPAILAPAIVAAQIPTIRADPPNGIRAVVHDSVITADEVDIAITDPATRLAQQFRSQPEMFQTKLNELRGAKLDELLGRRLILHEFKTAGYNLPESIVDELVQEEIRAEFR